MGDRLVQVIRYKGKFLAASYNHWSAGAADEFQEALDESIIKHGLFDSDANATPDLAVQCLIESIEKVHGGLSDGGLIREDWSLQDKTDFRKWNDYHSDVQAEFNKRHPEIHISTDTSDGSITVDEAIADDWVAWAEAVNNFEWTD